MIPPAEARGRDARELIWGLIDRADVLMYEAKQARRNTVRAGG